MARRRHPILAVGLISLTATAVGVAVALAIDWFPTPAASSSGEIDTLYNVLLVVSVPIFVLVMTVAIYSVYAFRVRPGDMRDGEPIHGNTRLEIVWVAVPFLIVTALGVYGWIVLKDVEAKKPNELTVKVTARQFAWSFGYPGAGKKVQSGELVLPKGRPVVFRIETKDVLHAFWVPEFRLKSDAVPGQTNKVRLTPNRLGRYEVVCTELCGIGHSTMRAPVRVVTPAAFRSWLNRNGG